MFFSDEQTEALEGSHVINKWRSHDLNPGSLAPEPILSVKVLFRVVPEYLKSKTSDVEKLHPQLKKFISWLLTEHQTSPEITVCGKM